MNTIQLNSPQKNIFYFSLPYLRNQDTIVIQKNFGDTSTTISIVDGWHNTDFLSGNREGQEAAAFIANTFPKEFLKSAIKDIPTRVTTVVNEVNQIFLQQFPKHISCVGTFIFHYADRTIITTIGTITTLLLKENIWMKPEEIQSNELDWKTHQSGSATFFGRGELQTDTQYSHRMDSVICQPSTPILVLTDGAQKILDTSMINTIFDSSNKNPDRAFIANLSSYIESNQHSQDDDISVLLTLPD